MNRTSTMMRCPKGYLVSGKLDETQQFLEEQKYDTGKWIYKPDSGTQGKGIQIFDDVVAIAKHAEAVNEEDFHFLQTPGKGNSL